MPTLAHIHSGLPGTASLDPGACRRARGPTTRGTDVGPESLLPLEDSPLMSNDGSSLQTAALLLAPELFRSQAPPGPSRGRWGAGATQEKARRTVPAASRGGRRRPCWRIAADDLNGRGGEVRVFALLLGPERQRERKSGTLSSSTVSPLSPSKEATWPGS